MTNLVLVFAALNLLPLFVLVLSADYYTFLDGEQKNYDRNVTTTINPKCPTNECVNFTLVHVQQEGIADVLHHIWTMENVPTFFYARTELNTEMLIDWEKMLSGNYSQAISFNKEPQYFAAVLIFKFFMYNDLNDTGVIPETDNFDIVSYSTKKMSWELKSSNCSGNVSASVAFRLSSYDGVALDFSSNIEITLTAYGTRGRSPILPHLAFTENSTQVDFVFDHVETKESFTNARLAMELAAVVSEPDSRFTLNVSQSLDDEYTPGVFKLMEVHSALNQHWIQWRPVCYTSTQRDIGDSTGLYQTEIRNVSDDNILDNTLLEWLSLDLDTRFLLMKGFNVSFGVEGDGFYRASNYTAWTLVTGHGRPVGDQFSLMVILVMAIGLGLPAIVLILGGAAIALRNHRNSKDDLLLSD
ncbi:glycosylated lysosomal membrane protein A-like [Daphnia pulex]|uniref:glycosylated lysosomal membrane protein A-like n=1 Tax=Daphnia pulex TaxID=6669 RepID=UPI001EDF6912|nr:glycosylated lysosomal membrane protein A-like [Daphnia pulex]